MRQDLSWDSRMMTTPSGAELPPSIQPHASHQCRELTSNSHGQRQLLPFLTCVLILISPVSCTDLVYVRSNSYGQLITSSTMRWVRDHGGLSGPKETAVTLGGASSQTICRVNHLGKKTIIVISWALLGSFLEKILSYITKLLSLILSDKELWNWSFFFWFYFLGFPYRSRVKVGLIHTPL